MKAKGMGGATLAYAQDSLAAVHNPAGIAWLDKRFDLSLELFNPVRHYDTAGNPSGMGGFVPGTVKSGREAFLIPSIGAVFPTAEGVFSLTLHGNGGMNTSWPAEANMGHGTFGGGAAGVNLEQMFVSGSYARKLNDTTSLGASVIYVLQKFSASGLRPFNPGSSHLSDNGDDESTGWGTKFGVTSKVNDKLTLAAVYQPRITMTKFQKYSGLFADHGGFDIPENYGVGLAYRPTDRSTLAFDVKHIKYSDVASVGNPFSNISHGLGEPDGPGFGWKDMTVYKLGYEWRPDDKTAYRAGMSYARQPIESSEILFNILAPGVQEWHFTLGMTRKTGDRGEWSFALSYSPEKSVSGINPLDQNQTVTLRMRQLEIEFGYGWKF